MTTADWTRTGEWDVLTLGGKVMPGIARVEVEIGSGLDVQKSKGAKKARVKDTGAPPAQLSIELVLLPANMDDFEAVLPVISPRSPTASKDGLSITHPNAKLWGVNTVKIGNISSPMPTPGGMLVIKIKAIEHIEAPKAVKKPSQVPVEAKVVPDWNGQVNSSTRELQSGPSRSGAPAQNFSSEPSGEGTGF